MKYLIIWQAKAEQDLAAIWLALRDRNAVTRASAEIEKMLSRAPLVSGVPLDSSIHRYAVLKPLGIEFEVVEDDKKVLVHAVWFVP